MKDWPARDWVAVIAAGGLVSWGILMILALWVRGGAMTEKTTEIFIGVAFALGNVIGIYMGKSLNGGTSK